MCECEWFLWINYMNITQYFVICTYSYNQVGIFLLLGLQYQSKDFKPQQQHFISQYFLSFFS